LIVEHSFQNGRDSVAIVWRTPKQHDS
jgi:hypothetical protein